MKNAEKSNRIGPRYSIFSVTPITCFRVGFGAGLGPERGCSGWKWVNLANCESRFAGSQMYCFLIFKQVGCCFVITHFFLFLIHHLIAFPHLWVFCVKPCFLTLFWFFLHASPCHPKVRYDLTFGSVVRGLLLKPRPLVTSFSFYRTDVSCLLLPSNHLIFFSFSLP